MSIICKATRPVYINKNDTTDNPFRLTPYVNDKHEIWLHDEGNGCGDDEMLLDVEGWTEAKIVREYGEFDLDAMRKDAEEMREDGHHDEADWLVDWCNTVAGVMSRVRYATIDARVDEIGTVHTQSHDSAEDAVNAAERAWGYLTDTEKAKRHILAAWSIANEDGEFDWGNYDIIKEFNV